MMHVELWSINRIKPYQNNPRRNDHAVEAVARSIGEFGFRQPIVVDSKGVIVVGNTRYKAAKRLELQKVPVHVAKGLTPAQIKAYRLADNKTAELAEWDQERLVQELAELQKLKIDLDVTGFSANEMQTLLDTEIGSGLADPDTVPEPPDRPMTQAGDLWVLGEHRLLCGDAASASAVDRLLGGAPVHLINTDPPYNVRVEPRSNNAIAAGLSSFAGPKHHQTLDLARHPAKSRPTNKKLRAKDRPLVNDLTPFPEPAPIAGLTDPDDIPEPPDEPVTRPGDLLILGDHRLLCGDAGKSEDVDRLLDGAEIHFVNTDPPYGVRVEPRSNNAIAAGLSSFQGTAHHQGLDLARHPKKAKPTNRKMRARDRALVNDFVSETEFDRILGLAPAKFTLPRNNVRIKQASSSPRQSIQLFVDT